jgi:hypothetical protein
MAILARRADREGRDLVEEEIEAVVVVEDDHDVRPLLRQPAVCGAEAPEERRPVRILIKSIKIVPQMRSIRA